MIASLDFIQQRLLEEVSLEHYRYLYDQLVPEDRLIGIVGARGVGKTTLMLQYMKNHYASGKEAYYFSADHIYFNTVSIYEVAEELYLSQGVRHLFIDEIHRYKNWSQEIKNLYDGFPDLKIYFSGSSSLDIISGSYDLSRRARMHYLPGMSFREYLNFKTGSGYGKLDLDVLINQPEEANKLISNIIRVKGHFKEFLTQGYYPFYTETPLSYYERILNIIEKTINQDIANYFNLNTVNLQHFKKILIYLAGIKPGTVSIHNIAKNMKIDDKTVSNYIQILEKTGLILQVFSAESGNQGLRRPDKIFLNNTNLQYALESHMGTNIEIGTVRELFFIQSIASAGKEVFHSKIGDYQVGKQYFEVGGKNKTRSQIRDHKNALLIKDDILVAKRGEIPLLFLGFLY